MVITICKVRCYVEIPRLGAELVLLLFNILGEKSECLSFHSVDLYGTPWPMILKFKCFNFHRHIYISYSKLCSVNE
jgi:hypothetical protein